MSTTDILMILATALSPLIAVQVTRYLDDRNEERGRKLRVFKTLMATRAYNLSPAHVEALNSIDLEFSQKKKGEKLVVEQWQQYLDHLGDRQMDYLLGIFAELICLSIYSMPWVVRSITISVKRKLRTAPIRRQRMVALKMSNHE